MTWVLEAARLSSSGLFGVVQTKGLALVWLQTTRTWLHDDSPDLAPTMATLDRSLRRAEAAMATLCGLAARRRRPSGSEPPAPEAPSIQPGPTAEV
jgi:hypothetical protein